jgi:hypothetical protein
VDVQIERSTTTTLIGKAVGYNAILQKQNSIGVSLVEN